VNADPRGLEDTPLGLAIVHDIEVWRRELDPVEGAVDAQRAADQARPAAAPDPWARFQRADQHRLPDSRLAIYDVPAQMHPGRRDAASLFRHRPSGEPNDGSACRRTALCRRAGTWPASPWSASTR